jgi:hypothetical protein
MSSVPFQSMSPEIFSLGNASVNALVLAALGGNSSVKPPQEVQRAHQIMSAHVVTPVTGYFHVAQNQVNQLFAAAALPRNQLALMASQGVVVPANVLSSSPDHLASQFNLRIPAMSHSSVGSNVRLVAARKQRPAQKAPAARKHTLVPYPYTSYHAASVPVSDSEASPTFSSLRRSITAESHDEGKATATRKRASRMCKAEGCPNTVVQGGVCISHGAKRKQCKTPGCTKTVKKAGLCSAHGPSRKRCEHDSCVNTAVQGGLCISHGAKKRICGGLGCAKKAKASWNHMCKRHFDLTMPAYAGSQDGTVVQCTVIGSQGST